MRYRRLRALKGYFLYYYRLVSYKIPKYLYLKLTGREIVHFLHVPKTGGSAFKKAVKNHKNNGNYFIALHPHIVRISDIPKGEKIIFFVRDPATRFVSAYNMRCRMMNTDKEKFLTESELEAFRFFHNANEVAEALSSSDPKRLNQALSSLKNTFFVSAMLSRWLINLEYLQQRKNDILYLGRQETLSVDFKKIKELLSLPESVRLPTDRVSANRAPADSDRYLSDLGLKNLRKYYFEDYLMVDLCDQIRKSIEKGKQLH